MAQTYTLGKVSITPRGEFSPNVVYSQLDLISYNGSSYLVTQNVFGIVPPNATYYMAIGSRGEKGDNGSAATVNVGSVSSVPHGATASITNVGTTANAILNFSLPTGNAWYVGTGITGTSTTATVFSGSGVSNAGVGDMYLNKTTGNTYQCTVGGSASVAKWVYVMCIIGTMDNAVAYTAQGGKTASQRTTALANVGVHIGTTAPSNVTISEVPVGELYIYIS